MRKIQETNNSLRDLSKARLEAIRSYRKQRSLNEATRRPVPGAFEVIDQFLWPHFPGAELLMNGLPPLVYEGMMGNSEGTVYQEAMLVVARYESKIFMEVFYVSDDFDEEAVWHMEVPSMILLEKNINARLKNRKFNFSGFQALWNNENSLR